MANYLAYSYYIVVEWYTWYVDLGHTSGHGSQAGHTGARALATGGCDPPVQVLLKIIGAECTVINHKLGAKSAQRCTLKSSCVYLYLQNNEVRMLP